MTSARALGRVACSYCERAFPASRARCPHCGAPRLDLRYAPAVVGPSGVRGRAPFHPDPFLVDRLRLRRYWQNEMGAGWGAGVWLCDKAVCLIERWYDLWDGAKARWTTFRHKGAH